MIYICIKRAYNIPRVYQAFSTFYVLVWRRYQMYMIHRVNTHMVLYIHIHNDILGSYTFGFYFGVQLIEGCVRVIDIYLDKSVCVCVCVCNTVSFRQ